MAVDRSARSNKLFDAKRASSYEDRVRQVVPGYEALHDLCYLLLNQQIGSGGHILVAGCGSGTDVLSLARECPERTFTAFDPSPDMVEMAKVRISEAALIDKTHLINGTIDEIDSGSAFDAAILMLVLHFVPDQDGPLGKAHLLRAIGDHLKPSSPLFFAEALADRSNPDFDTDMDLWRQIMRLAGMDPVAEEKGFKKIVSQMPLIGEGRLKELLDQAGFNSPKLFYKAHMIHGWVAIRR